MNTNIRIFLVSIFLKNCSTIDLGWQEGPLFGRAEDGRHFIVVHLIKELSFWKKTSLYKKIKSSHNGVNMGHGKYMYLLVWMYITNKDCHLLHTGAIFKQKLCFKRPVYLFIFLKHPFVFLCVLTPVCVSMRPVCVCVCLYVLTPLCVSMRPVCETMAEAGCSTDSCQRSSLPSCTLHNKEF